MSLENELREKDIRIRDFMNAEGLNALALSTIGNFAWATCGGNNYVGIATDAGVASAVFTNDAKYIVCDNIEARRIMEEEVAGQGFELRSCCWYESKREDIIREIADGGVLGSDSPIAGAKNIATELDPYRYSLTPEEIERYKWLGENTGRCLKQAACAIEPGMTEHQIAGVLNQCLYGSGITPVVTLIAADERILSYRHPIPTDNKLKRYAMLVTGARKWGLIVSASRLVHFGEVPADLRCKHYAVTHIDAAFIAHTTPGAVVGDVFKKAVEAYRETGYADEWTHHHQGGPTGYKGREFRATMNSEAVVVENQAYAWNPSIAGTKSEDTIIATSDGPIILSEIKDWPGIDCEVEGVKIRRPDILVR